MSLRPRYFREANVGLGNSTWAGASAAIMANVVLIGYILVAFNEDQSEALEVAENEKKESKKTT